MDKKERRHINVSDLRVEEREGEQSKIAGHAAVFGEEYQLYSDVWEVIEPGAFTNAIKNDDIRALINHDPSLLLGRNKSGTLRLHEDDRGLAMEVDLPDTSYANNLKVSMERGDITQQSFGFVPIREEMEKTDKGVRVHLLEVGLRDVSPVTFPAYKTTDVGLRTRDEYHSAYKAQEEADVTQARDDCEDEKLAQARRLLDLRERELKNKE